MNDICCYTTTKLNEELFNKDESIPMLYRNIQATRSKMLIGKDGSSSEIFSVLSRPKREIP